jgi:hypothetical protein
VADCPGAGSWLAVAGMLFVGFSPGVTSCEYTLNTLMAEKDTARHVVINLNKRMTLNQHQQEAMFNISALD